VNHLHPSFTPPPYTHPSLPCPHFHPLCLSPSCSCMSLLFLDCYNELILEGGGRSGRDTQQACFEEPPRTSYLAHTPCPTFEGTFLTSYLSTATRLALIPHPPTRANIRRPPNTLHALSLPSPSCTNRSHSLSSFPSSFSSFQMSPHWRINVAACLDGVALSVAGCF
jgi:hypothetical protein